MKTSKTIVTVVGVSMLLLATGCTAGGNTMYSSGFSKVGFDAIQIGASVETVISNIGLPFDCVKMGSTYYLEMGLSPLPSGEPYEYVRNERIVSECQTTNRYVFVLRYSQASKDPTRPYYMCDVEVFQGKVMAKVWGVVD